ncbi:MAG: hypothetical protein AAFU55_11160, partial [Pseudomonadota bacterium]
MSAAAATSLSEETAIDGAEFSRGARIDRCDATLTTSLASAETGEIVYSRRLEFNAADIDLIDATDDATFFSMRYGKEARVVDADDASATSAAEAAIASYSGPATAARMFDGLEPLVAACAPAPLGAPSGDGADWRMAEDRGSSS